MALYLVTGNKHKYEEFKTILPNLERLVIDIPEIQSNDQKHIMKEKLKEVMKRRKGEFLVEDTGLYLDCMNGFPGPLVKWMIEKVGSEGLVEIAEKMDNTKAEAKTMIGLAEASGNMEFFQGVTKGKLVHPRTESEFDWDKIFQPEGHNQTYAEMNTLEKNQISQRGKALEKLREYLDSRQ